jgi:SAM-dependent methyltransferase
MTHALYDRIGPRYSLYRRPDARIAAAIRDALGASSSVVNIGAGSGSYEPADRFVAAVEPSAEMIRQRREGSAPALRATADCLPFQDRSFEAALAILTMHHWPDWRLGLREMKRVAPDRVVIFTWDPDHPSFWLVQDYFPDILTMDRKIAPSFAEIQELIGPFEIWPVPIPADCSDGFLGAYWRRPESYLDTGVRSAISAFHRLTSQQIRTGLVRLRADVESGAWRRRYAKLMEISELDIGYRLLVAANPSTDGVSGR